MDFPKVIPNELFYTYILRYHHYSGNMHLRSSFYEFFGLENNINSVLFPVGINKCLDTINMSKEKYLREHSIMPYYRMFLSKEFYEDICNEIFYGSKGYTSKLLKYHSLGDQIKSDRLYYCPLCMKEHMQYETIKRFHQIKEVHVCPKHQCFLNNVSLLPYRRLLNPSKWDYTVTECNSDSILLHIAEDVEYIIENSPEMDIKILRDRLFEEALFRGAYELGMWQWAKDRSWEVYYQNLPVEYGKYKYKVDFERLTAPKLTGGVDPIEYLLLIRSLFGGFKRFVMLYE